MDGIFGKLTEEAVKNFQKNKGLTPDGIVGAKTWAALPSSNINPRVIKEIIVHCSATLEGKDFTVEQIRQCHLQRGFSDIGYHYVIYRDGTIHVGRNEALSGAHCTNHNNISIGVCYVGGCDATKKLSDGQPAPKDTRTNAQKVSLVNLLRSLKSKYPKAVIHSHRDFANKACPSFDATNEYKNL